MKRLSYIILTVMLIQFAGGVESADAATAETDYFTIELPADWKVEKARAQGGASGAVILPSESEKEEYRTFSVITPDGKRAFEILVAADGPRFIPCLCASPEEYTRYEKDGVKFAAIAFPEINVRSLKAVGKKYGIDVHLEYEDFDRKLLDQILDSIRPK